MSDPTTCPSPPSCHLSSHLNTITRNFSSITHIPWLALLDETKTEADSVVLGPDVQLCEVHKHPIVTLLEEVGLVVSSPFNTSRLQCLAFLVMKGKYPK